MPNLMVALPNIGGALAASGGSSFSALGWPVGGPADIMEGPMATVSHPPSPPI